MPDSTTKHALLLVAALSTPVSLLSFLYYYRQGAILLSGDAVAHINIARRVFDSQTPGPLQLGTAWLPLQHMLTIPWVVSDWAWRTGAGGSVVSMAAYVFAALGIFRLLSRLASRASAWLAVFIFAANPNLIYVQTTALNEPLYLALSIWATVFFADFAEGAGAPDASRFWTRRGEGAGEGAASPKHDHAATSLHRCAMALAAAMLTRYDGWFLAGIISIASFWIIARGRGTEDLRKAWRRLAALVFLTAALWLGYNFGVYGNALEFLNGPYSARAIAERALQSGQPPHPGDHHLATAAIYFLQVSALNLGAGSWPHLLLALAGLPSLLVVVAFRRFLPAMLLWTPFPFYSLSIAYGSVPIFFPDWWPHSYYNVRYGLEILPAVAAFTAIGCELVSWRGDSRRRERIALAALAVLAAASYGSMWRRAPIGLQEARANGAARVAFESRLAAELQRLPPTAPLMMYSGDHVGALQRAGIPLRRVLTEGNFAQWEGALSSPSQAAEYIVAMDDDPVARAVARHPEGLRLVAQVRAPGNLAATIYRGKPSF